MNENEELTVLETTIEKKENVFYGCIYQHKETGRWIAESYLAETKEGILNWMRPLKNVDRDSVYLFKVECPLNERH